MFKLVVVLLLLGVIASLASGLYFILREQRTQRPQRRAVRALTWRVGLSIALFVVLIVGSRYGLLSASGP